MKKILILTFTIIGLCGFSDLAVQSNDVMEIESNNRDWEVSMRGTSMIRAYNTENQVELLINIASLLPSSPDCINSKRIRDIKFSVDIYKVADSTDTNWAKSFEKTRIYFYGSQGSDERKVYGSNLVKNNQKFSVGTVVHIGSLLFLSPYTCNDIYGMSMRITQMKSGGRNLPPLDFTLKKQ